MRVGLISTGTLQHRRRQEPPILLSPCAAPADPQRPTPPRSFPKSRGSDLRANLRGDLGERSRDGRFQRDRPEQVSPEAHLLDVRSTFAASGAHQRRLGQHLAPVMPRHTTEPCHGRADDSASTNPSRSENAPSACNPTWDTTPAPPGSAFTRRVLTPFNLKCPAVMNPVGLGHQQFPTSEELFRGRAQITSIGAVKNQS